MSDLFEAVDYKVYLRETLAPEGETRGMRARLARALGCQNAYISQVLNGTTHLSLEHALTTARFLALDAEATDYFLWLVERDRAASAELRAHFQSRLDEVKRRRSQARHRIAPSERLSLDVQARYYSNVEYSLIHILLGIPALQTKSALAAKLGLTPDELGERLAPLIEAGLIEERRGKLIRTRSSVHLDPDSPFIRVHHANYRVFAIEHLRRPKPDDFYFSGVYSLSNEAFAKVRSILLSALEGADREIRPSNDEVGAVLNLDWFRA